MAVELGVIFGLGFKLLDLDINCLILHLQAEGGETIFSSELRNSNLAVAGASRGHRQVDLSSRGIAQTGSSASLCLRRNESQSPRD